VAVRVSLPTLGGTAAAAMPVCVCEYRGEVFLCRRQLSHCAGGEEGEGRNLPAVYRVRHQTNSIRLHAGRFKRMPLEQYGGPCAPSLRPPGEKIHVITHSLNIHATGMVRM